MLLDCISEYKSYSDTTNFTDNVNYICKIITSNRIFQIIEMMFSRLFLLVGFGILCQFVSRVSGHAYFVYPTPRNVYCANDSCTTNGELKPQGPIWKLPANSTFETASSVSQTTCNGTDLAVKAPIGDTYDPGFKSTTASWPAGSTQTFQIFVSHLHSPENQTIYPTDGWQIRYRDGTQSDSKFSPIESTYVDVSTKPSIGPHPAIGFKLGQIVSARITVPSKPTTDGIFQFYWRNNEAGPGLMWLSCADVTITSSGTSTTPSTSTSLGTITVTSTLPVVFAALLIAVNAALNI